MQYFPPGVGSIEVICGSMFAGKTEELIRRIKRVQIAKRPYHVFKPRIDNRYSEDHVVSHSGMRIETTVVEGSFEMMQHLEGAKDSVIAVDEAQFFDEHLAGNCELLANFGNRVIVAGLDQDAFGNPFGPMPNLLVSADHITKLSAVCTICGGPATKSEYLKEDLSDKGGVVVGGKESYEARCRKHWSRSQKKS
jgi:thymidine kinase